MKKTAKVKKQISYYEAHNKAVRMYRRTSIFLLWVGILNAFAVILGVIQSAAGAKMSELAFDWPNSGFSLAMSVQMLINSLLIQNLDATIADILMIIIALAISAAFAALGVFAGKGKLWVLILGAALYAADFGSMFFIFNSGFVPNVLANYSFSLVTHIAILAACLFAIVEYYNVIHIEKVFRGSKPNKIEEEVESEVIANGK